MSCSRPEQRHQIWATLQEGEETYLSGVRESLRETLARSRRARARSTRDLTVSTLERRSQLEDLIEPLVDGGGKLIRPRLVLMGYVATACSHQDAGSCAELIADASHRTDLIDLGCAFELLHAFGLLHDDVMDESDLRRGRPTAHQRMATHHDRALGGRGATRFGESIAILAGDLAFALAHRQLRYANESTLVLWDEAVVELVQGQRLDLVFAAEGRFDAASTRRVAQAKSGSYTVTRPLQIGAAIATPDRVGPDWLQDYGRHVGDAFALADDLLGIWGDSTLTGKPVGDDITQKKPSTVLGIADQILGGEVGRLLRCDRPSLTHAETRDLIARMEERGVKAETQTQIAHHVAAAESAASHAPCPAVQSELCAIAHRLAYRAR